MDIIQDYLNKIKDAENVITDSLAQINRATKVISDNPALISGLVAKEVQRQSLSTGTPPGSLDSLNEGKESHLSESIQTSNDGFLCPDCGKRNKNEQARRRHYATHIPCAQISPKDEICVCCKKPMKLASNFEKYHKACVTRMGGRLSETTRVEASQQKSRIANSVIKLLHTNIRKARDRGGDKPSSDRRTNDFETSAFNSAPQSDSGNGACNSDLDSCPPALGSLPFLLGKLDPETGPSRNANLSAQLESYQALYEITDIPGMVANISDDIYRGSAMVLNPIDGVLDWDIPNM
ncbi:hypothetical protein GGR57DRAFT_268164 [Xylariaceae sp. FL1272]|nr:hypothetical protein GGR57DRAFT_268164 [Xylariaceae sp. FL1272]